MSALPRSQITAMDYWRAFYRKGDFPLRARDPASAWRGSGAENSAARAVLLFRGAELRIVRASDGHSPAVQEPCVNIIYQPNVMIIME